ncbi:uncharacterized protein ColSpa_01988 [Colletotrichum spaethianum]|uniref:Uncharacterized protein n=1 Tax=Colletotrichum spaethianum TaxID=700344 RepID=A0AA37L4P1_9PEZI|nr:uncharacterized protein ColSpa_01988 [Colletotrichum spaethianum]GKT41807.1 hypothetical protein ColSpa_01988 [Colletotrichum spaethianum]
MESGKKYVLRITSDESDLNNATFFLGGGQNLLLKTPAAATAEQSIVVKSGPTPSTIIIDSPTEETLILQGPVGKGEHQLRASTKVTPFGIGSAICHNSWEVVEDASTHRLLLRYKNENFGNRSWVAVPPRGPEENTWAVWWYEPLPFNARDLPGAVAVDIEVVPV